MDQLVLLYTEVLVEPLKEMVKSHNPTTLKDAINLTRDLQNVFPKTRYSPKPDFPSKLKEGRKPWKNDSFLKDKNEGPRKEELKINKLCFTCLQPWVPRYKCEKGKAHYIEVLFEDEEREESKKQELHTKKSCMR